MEGVIKKIGNEPHEPMQDPQHHQHPKGSRLLKPTLQERLALANAAPRCGARNRAGSSCCAPAMANGRCRLHGGKSTGPITCKGLERSRKANWQHGHYSAGARESRSRARADLRCLRDIIAELQAMGAW